MRVPLHIKLVVSYLLVVGLALLPTAIYLRTSLHKEQVASVRHQLSGDLVVLCQRLASSSPAELAARASAVRFSFLTRITVMNVQGEVLADSERPDSTLPNHRNRPEFQAALANGEGTAERVSATTGRRTLYVARRCGGRGVTEAVARLGERLDGIESGRDQIEAVLRNAGAVALSVAVLLGLVAALAAVKPLRTIASAAHRIAAGDFGTQLHVSTGDEIEEVAHAINAVVAMLRDRLVASGAERATTQAIFDELPVGVVVFDADRQVTRLNPAARRLCGLEPGVEAARGAELTKLSGQRAAMERAAVEARGESVALALPWKPEAILRARWVRVYDEDGGDTAAVIIADASADVAQELRARCLRDVAEVLRRAARESPEASVAETYHRLADRCVEVASPEPLKGAAMRVATLDELIEHAWSELGAMRGGRRVRLVGEGLGEVIVAERGDRCRDAIRSLLRWAAGGGGEVELRGIDEGSTLRLSARRAPSADDPPGSAATLRELSGDMGQRYVDDDEERWIVIPRA